ncbi:asparagine synthase (glutamine-hydrolyzing) [Adhaeribacter pallidiroseus]|uniref:asparagine synthase (glutamine-hydrolyzing) n=1 Tax=Adhaeribacter pallidiroseus TaxID=2072847 RepID=A0A369QMN9_9BACT|nr:asparagine synthase (glutamine-hydrolyzing) [Adhaeribacter pallidiroseus]RDC64109.1 Asparagine synthase (glutamine-hydrolyzing) [Adhaeribacter pallidiroseus]
MCGITGFVDFTHKTTKKDLEQATKVIAHRGPDAVGFYFDNTCGLGHRRLSILDLSVAANQPFYSSDGRYSIIYNGEVYNFQEIGLKLGISLKTTSDTEVILEAFIRWGPEFVNELNGMFAFAIFDLQTQTLFLYRDRMGVKPIYYYYDGERFAFASELKSIIELPFIKNNISINKEAISQFLYLGYIPRPNSIYNEVQKLDSGTYLVLSQTSLKKFHYWQLAEQVESEVLRNEKLAKQTLKDLVISSVKYRMISDVPFGTFLSGGIDSSLVTAAAQHVSDKPVKTFSIAFEATKFNEAKYAAAVSKHLGTEHYEFTVTEKEALEWVDQLTGIYDEPFADSSAIPTLLVSELARKKVTMILSGDGGDELFMGYGMYQWADRLANPFVRTFRKPIAAFLPVLGNRFERAAHVFQYSEIKRLKSHIFSQEQYLFSEAEIDKLLTPAFRSKPIIQENWNYKSRRLTPKEEQAFFDMCYYLQDDLLVKVDRATMRHSLEARVPLLDYRIVEFALNLSPDLKVKGGITKYLLKQVLYDFLPKELFNRPKWGFSIPLSTWLQKDLKYLIEDYLSEKIINTYEVVSYSEVKILKECFLQGKDYLYNRVWLLIVLHKWLVNNM